MNTKMIYGAVFAVVLLVVLYGISQRTDLKAPVVENPIASTSTKPVAENPEGEADPARMTLSMNTWRWIDARNPAGKFTLTFGTDGRFSAKTDCNGVGGSYTSSKTTISFGQMMSTLMFCEGSYESEFSQALSSAETYSFTNKGELILGLKGGGVMTFK